MFLTLHKVSTSFKKKIKVSTSLLTMIPPFHYTTQFLYQDVHQAFKTLNPQAQIGRLLNLQFFIRMKHIIFTLLKHKVKFYVFYLKKSLDFLKGQYGFYITPLNHSPLSKFTSFNFSVINQPVGELGTLNLMKSS